MEGELQVACESGSEEYHSAFVTDDEAHNPVGYPHAHGAHEQTGLLGQEVIKVISGQNRPCDNWLFLDGRTGASRLGLCGQHHLSYCRATRSRTWLLATHV